jgi:hypothetical protein
MLPALALADTVEHRPMPDYEGRPSETTVGDVAIWIPRVLFSPIYFITEYVIRWPLGLAISGAERSNLPQYLYDFFFFGPDHKAGFAPIAFIDFGFNPSLGLFAFWDDAGMKGHNIRFHGSGWTGGWLAGVLSDRLPIGEHDQVTFTVDGIRRPDYTFYGIGPRSRNSLQSRYGQDTLDAKAMFDIPLWRASKLTLGSGFKSVALYHGHFNGDASIEKRVAEGYFPTPTGFGRGYTEEYNHALGALDSRRPRPAPGSGVRLEAEGEQGSDVRRSPAAGWIRWGGTAAGFWDIDGHNRVLSLSMTARFADQLGTEKVPFTELVSFGGSEALRGYYPGRLVDRSGTAATLHYRWPIWVWLDGSLQAAVGNVFGEHLDGFKPSLLRFSSAVGIESVGTPDNSLELLFGVGSETFASGAKIDSLRIQVGTNRGF